MKIQHLRQSLQQIFILAMMIISSNLLFSQDLNGVWSGKIKDKVKGQPFNNGLGAELTLQHIGNNEYLGFIRISKKFSSGIKILGGISGTEVPPDYEGSFLVRARLLNDRTTLTFSIKQLIEYKGNFLRWCAIDTTLKLDKSFTSLEGEYKTGCVSDYGASSVLNEGRISFEKTKKAPSETALAVLKSYTETSLEVSPSTSIYYTFSPVNSASKYYDRKNQSAIKFGTTNKLSFTIKNKGKVDRYLNCKFVVSDKTNRLPNKEYLITDRFIDTAQSQELYMEYDCPFDVESDSLQLFFEVTDKSSGQVIARRDAALPVQTLLPKKIVVMPSSTAGLMNSYYRMNNSTQTRNKLEEIHARGNDTAIGWKAWCISIGRCTYSKDYGEGAYLREKFLQKFESATQSGNAEIIYLVAVCKMLDWNPQNQKIGRYLLAKCAAANYAPAQYDLARLQLQTINKSQLDSALLLLENLYTNGNTRAAIALAKYYSKTKDQKALATQWLDKIADKSDYEYLETYAEYYSIAEANNDNLQKAETYSNKALAAGSTWGYEYLAGSVIYLKKTELAGKAMTYLKTAADNNSVDAMYSLGSIQYSDQIFGPKYKNVPEAVRWFEKAAKKGHAKAMKLLGEIYNSGIGGEKDLVKSRYWKNKAGSFGETGVNTVTSKNTGFSLGNIIDNFDFSPRRQVEVYEDGVLVDQYEEGPDPFELFFDAVGTTVAQGRQPTQEVFINAIEYIQSFMGNDIYAGTVSSFGTTGFRVKKGQELSIQANGVVYFGNMAGRRLPSGQMVDATNLAVELAAGMNRYNLVPQVSHGAFLIRIAGGDWIPIGTGKTIIADRDGTIDIAVNDTEPENNNGYFDFVITTKSE
ncbi:MAG: tetratricopeptide repeat protein [Chitinophagaceae bacterium]|nr:tetratricopeptide repeat protein [Chitinophagaceae bacterium]